MAISKSAGLAINKTIRGIYRHYNGTNGEEGFFIADDKIISHARACFGFWDFASKINIVTVEDREGDSFLSAFGNPASSRTDIKAYERKATPLLANHTHYKVAQMNTDVAVSYKLLNQWAMSSRSFSKEYSTFTLQRVGMDRLIAGWHGVTVEPNTDPSKNPTLDNLAHGWLHNISSQFPSRILGAGNDIIQVGGTAPTPVTDNKVHHFANLDQAVLACISMIPAAFREGLVCIVGAALLEDEMARVYGGEGYIFEKHKNPDVFNNFGNIPRVDCPGFPQSGLVVTSAENLSLYIKSGTSYRQITNNVQYESITDYQTCELAYVVENPNAFYAFNPSCVVLEGMAGYSKDMRAEIFGSANKHEVIVA